MGGDRHELISPALHLPLLQLASEMDHFRVEKVILDYLETGRKWASQEPELAADGPALVLEHS